MWDPIVLWGVCVCNGASSPGWRRACLWSGAQSGCSVQCPDSDAAQGSRCLWWPGWCAPAWPRCSGARGAVTRWIAAPRTSAHLRRALALPLPQSVASRVRKTPRRPTCTDTPMCWSWVTWCVAPLEGVLDVDVRSALVHSSCVPSGG